MDSGFIILWMIFMHIVDDYYLQGWLASAKQKSWWEKNSPDELYKRDYIMALFMHAFSWTFMIMLPVFYVYKFALSWPFLIAFVANLIIHAYVDNLKANKKKINLRQDQLIHLLQICSTAFIFL